MAMNKIVELVNLWDKTYTVSIDGVEIPFKVTNFEDEKKALEKFPDNIEERAKYLLFLSFLKADPTVTFETVQQIPRHKAVDIVNSIAKVIDDQVRDFRKSPSQN